jgi:hypothetical protein
MTAPATLLIPGDMSLNSDDLTHPWQCEQSTLNFLKKAVLQSSKDGVLHFFTVEHDKEGGGTNARSI